MNPDTSNPGGDMQAQSDAGSPLVPSPDEARLQQSAATNLIRSQIDSLYNGSVSTDVNQKTIAVQPKASVEPVDSNPYHRTHTAHPAPQAEQWKQYHTAWQNYYQKYYENYYTAQIAATPAAIIAQKANTSKNSIEKESYFSQHLVDAPETAEELSNDQALFELRQKLLGKVQASAHKIRKSRHFIPISAALVVVLLFVFIQYNRVFIANVKAYVSPGSIDPQNIVVDPTADIVVSAEPRLIIPKINVDVPVSYDVGTDNDSQMKAMANGLAHFPIAGASSHPGEIGNTVLAGHSSNDLFDGGDYKFIFAQLEKLAIGDSVYANYKSKRYTYVVTKIEIVKPTEVSKLVYKTDKPVLTLLTCTPLGTALNRLLVTAEQVSPDPTAATPAPVGSGQETSGASIPGSGPTLLEKLFGAR